MKPPKVLTLDGDFYCGSLFICIKKVIKTGYLLRNVICCLGVYSDQKEYTIFYIGNKEGQVYKVAQWIQEGKLRQAEFCY